MSLYSATELRSASGALTASLASETLSKSASTALDTFDIFLSHSLSDAQVILGLKRVLESRGNRVYVDWIEDKLLSREYVTASTAATLRRRMRQSNSMVYATSRAAGRSRWMPWELGFFDGIKGESRVAICLIEVSSDDSFIGQEYLGLYKRLEKLQVNGQDTPYITRFSGQEAQTIESFRLGTGRFVRVGGR